jgi:hypothetical protein
VLHLKDLDNVVSPLLATLAGRSISVASKELTEGDEERWGCPSPALFLKRYESKGVRGWGSAKDMTGKDLGGSWGSRAEGKSGEGKSRREFDALYTKQL